MNRLLRLAFGLASGHATDRRLSVLNFHRVSAEPDPLFPGEMYAERFDRLCAMLKHCAHVMPLDTAVAALRDQRLPARALAITFDDGYADNHDQALPVLRRHGLTATFFVATGFMGGGCMWNDRIIESVRRCKSAELDLRPQGLGLHRMGDIDSQRRAIESLIAAIKYRQPAERLERCDAIAAAAGVTMPTDLMMTWEQVRALHASGMQIGAHTVDHPILAELDAAEAAYQIAQSRQTLQAMLGAPVTLFAYPNGRLGQDVSPRTVDVLRPLGFDAAVTTEPGAADGQTDLLLIPRFTPWDADPRRFMLRLVHNLLRSRFAGSVNSR
ncbi:MAG: polysaccharide deacetylase family protein [Aquabacterium sp.]|nr:polysaccharide deacetylase family protein [Aquabacterium sp.]